MTTTEAVDPQYLWILPKYLELTYETKRLADRPASFSAETKDRFLHCFASLTLLGCYTHWTETSDRDYDNARKRKQAFPVLSKRTTAVFLHREMCLGAMHHNGLDIRGGIVKIDTLRFNSKIRKHGFPTASMLVTNPEKARKYVNIGVQVSASTLMHHNPTTLEEAVKNYSLILSLISPNNESPRTAKEIDKDISDTIDTDKIWELKREKFINEVRDRYREVMMDMVMEEKLSSLQDRKRRRISSA